MAAPCHIELLRRLDDNVSTLSGNEGVGGEGEGVEVELALTSNSLISTQSGDVVIQSPEEFNVAWSAHTNYYCLGAPNGGSISATSGPTNCFDSAGNSGNAGSTTCSATYAICPSSSGCSGGGPTVTVTANQGSIYANAITGTG